MEDGIVAANDEVMTPHMMLSNIPDTAWQYASPSDDAYSLFWLHVHRWRKRTWQVPGGEHKSSIQVVLAGTEPCTNGVMLGSS